MPDPRSSAAASRRMAGPPLCGTGTGLAEGKYVAPVVDTITTSAPDWWQAPGRGRVLHGSGSCFSQLLDT